MTDFGWDLPPGVTTADIDRAFGGDEPYERLLERLPDTCPRCGAATMEPDPTMRGTTARIAGHVRVADVCRGYEATCDAALFADHDDVDVAAEECETVLAESPCQCRDCTYDDSADDERRDEARMLRR